MHERLESFIDLGIALAVQTAQSQVFADRTPWDDFVERFRAAADAPLPRTHKRLRIPVDVAARMLKSVGEPPHAYDRFLLPPSVQALSAEQLEHPATHLLATQVMDAWRDLIPDLAVPDALADIWALLEPDKWPAAVDPGDFPPRVAVPPREGDPWDASTRAALASLSASIPADTSIALLLGLWSGAGRSPQLPQDWDAAESWIGAPPLAIRETADLASARVWAMSVVSPLFQDDARTALDTFVAWAYRRAGTWATFTSIDPEIHQKLREQWPTPPNVAEGLWPQWVRTAVRTNRMVESPPAVVPVRRAATIAALLEELNALVGLVPVKEEIRSIVDLVRLDQAKAEKGLPTAPLDLHLVLTGNPGTGKTTVARLYGQILKALGVLRTGAFIEVTRADLVGPHKSEASERTRAALDSADGGVLFIDEAYSLATGSVHDDGTEVINELVAAMESRRGSIAIVVAGYPGPMAKFMAANPGLRGRFRDPVLFPDMPDAALLEALNSLATKEGFRIEDAAIPAVRAWILAIPRGEGFGNVREMRKLLGILKQGVATRYAHDPQSTAVDLILEEDVPIVGPGKFDPLAYEQALERLNHLVGLQPVKDVMTGLASQARLAQMRRDKGQLVSPIDIGHMVFTGNPGTGKTTVAGRLGEIFAALGLLRTSYVHTVGRADLIGQFTGQTPPKVREAVWQALDGILFIDEAYSLAPQDHWDGYAREAVTTLVDEMERYRGRLVVIMAGYPAKMERFLASNEGLKSRVRHTIDFPDFDRAQLRDITLDMVTQQGMLITAEAADAITEQAMLLAGAPGFANARTVRNLVAQASDRHAIRIVNATESRQGSRALETLEKQDVGTTSVESLEQFGLYL